jgi:regulator of PEP synthase PpsR (kinase-PPPase family)
MHLFQDLGILIVDVTGKAIEEIASDIINTLKI